MENVFLIKLTELMELKGLTRKELATAIDVSYRAVSDYFNNDVIPRKQTLEKIAQFFNVPISYLVPSEGAPSNKSIGIPFYFDGMTKEGFYNLDKDNAGFLPLTFHDSPYIAAYLVQSASMSPTYEPDSVALLDFDIESDSPTSLASPNSVRQLNDCYLIKNKDDNVASIRRVQTVMDVALLLLESDNPLYPRRTVKPSDIQIIAKIVGKLDSLDFMVERNIEHEKPIFESNTSQRRPKRKIIFTEWNPSATLGDLSPSNNESVRMDCANFMTEFFSDNPYFEFMQLESKTIINKKGHEILIGVRIWYSYTA